MLFLLHNLSVQTLLIVGYVMKKMARQEQSLMLLLRCNLSIHNLSVQTCSLVPDDILFVSKTESLMLLLLHYLYVQTLLIVGSSMKLIRETEKNIDSVTASQSICSNL